MALGLGLSPAKGGVRTLAQAVRSILRKYGPDAHMWLPSDAPTKSGFTAGNYLDSAGTTPATIDGSTGLVLDAAGSVSAELANGFLSGWTGTGWTFSGGVASASAATNPASRLATVTAGKTYRVTLRCSSFTSGGYKLLYEGGASLYGDKTSAGEFTANLAATTTGGIYIWCNSALTASFDKFEIKEITGLHASQATAGYKPTERRGIVNLLTQCANFSDASWGNSNVSIGASVADPLGEASARTLTANAANAELLKSFSGLTSGQTYTDAVWIRRRSGTGTISIPRADGLAWIDVTAQVSSDWAIVVTQYASSGSSASGVKFGTSGDSVDVFRCGVFAGTLTASQIQQYGGIPTTTTVPASSANGPNYWAFDGGDHLSATPMLQLSDSWCITAAVSNVSNPTWNTIFSQGHSSMPARIQFFIENGNAKAYVRDDNYVAELIDSGVSIGLATAVVSIVKIGSSWKIRVNGVERANALLATFGAATFTLSSIGSLNGSGDYFKGNIHALQPEKGTFSDADIIQMEKFAASQAGGRLVSGAFVGNI